MDETLVGKVGRVTGTVAAGTVGEVMLAVRGGSEAFYAYPAEAGEAIEPGAPTLRSLLADGDGEVPSDDGAPAAPAGRSRAAWRAGCRSRRPTARRDCTLPALGQRAPRREESSVSDPGSNAGSKAPLVPRRLQAVAAEAGEERRAPVCGTCRDGDGVVWMALPDGSEEARQCPECQARIRRRSAATSAEEARTLAERVNRLERRLAAVSEGLLMLLPHDAERLRALLRELER